MDVEAQAHPDFRRTLIIVVALNLAYFVVQLIIALAISSVSLTADAADYLEDSAINLLILAGLNWPAKRRAALAKVLAAIILLPSLAALLMVWHKFSDPVVPAPLALTLTGFGALVINLTCAILLARFRHTGGSLTKAAFLSARNDAVANVAIIIGGILTAYTHSVWPDVAIGLFVAALNIGAAFEVYEEAMEEGQAPATL